MVVLAVVSFLWYNILVFNSKLMQQKIQKHEVYDPRLFRAWQMSNQGDEEGAVKLLQKILAEEPKDRKTILALADTWITHSRVEEALKLLDWGVKLYPRDSALRYLRGFLYGNINRFDDSIADLEVSNEERPNCPDTLRNLGWALCHNKDHKRGFILLHRAEALMPNNGDIHGDLAMCYLLTQNFERAVHHTNKALAADPLNPLFIDLQQTIMMWQDAWAKLDER